MTTFDKVKKEAIRLFKIAKKTPNQHGIPSITLQNLSQSQEVIAQLNGFPNWYEYQNHLKIRETVSENTSKKTQISQQKKVLEDLTPFCTSTPFVFHRDTEFFFYRPKEPAPRRKRGIYPAEVPTTISLGTYFDQSNLFNRLKSIKKANQSIDCDTFPLAIIGNENSGVRGVDLSIAEQFISQGRGFVMIDPIGTRMGNTYAYRRFALIAQEQNRFDDLYLINLQAPFECESHKINLIMPFIDDKEFIDKLVGSSYSEVIYACFNSIREWQGIVAYDTLNYFLSIENVVNLLDNPIFETARGSIEHYLEEIEYADDTKRAIKRHALNSVNYKAFLDEIAPYPFVFSIEPDITIEAILSQKKLLSIIFPIEKDNPSSFFHLGDLITRQLLDKKYRTSDTGVLLSKFDFYLREERIIELFSSVRDRCYSDRRKIIFSMKSISSPLQKIICNNCDSFLLMQLKEAENDGLAIIKLKMFDSLEYFPSPFKENRLAELKYEQGFYFKSILDHLDISYDINKKRRKSCFFPLKNENGKNISELPDNWSVNKKILNPYIKKISKE